MKLCQDEEPEKRLYTVYYFVNTTQRKNSVLQKVGESLYRYSSNKVYYARIKVNGKEIS